MNSDPANKLQTLRGWTAIVMGAFLTVGMTILTLWFSNTVNHPIGKTGSQWTGSHAMTMAVFELFTTILLFGIVSFAGGIYQLRRKRISKIAFALMMLLVLVMFFLGKQIMANQPAS